MHNRALWTLDRKVAPPPKTLYQRGLKEITNMSENRRIRKVFTSRPTIEGAGVRLHRAFGFGDPELFDPFLLLDDFRSDTPQDYVKGFPWHPHRGIETITYVLAGNVEHTDSTGNGGAIGPGDVQWMTAGSGIMRIRASSATEKKPAQSVRL